MSKFARTLSILIVAIMLGVALASCGTTPTTEPPAEPVVEETAPVAEETTEPEPTEPVDTPLVVAYNAFSQKFSPFFADTAYDVDVAGMTQIGMMTTDRVGAIVFNAIEGETRSYNGVDYFYSGPADLTVDYDEASDTTKYTAHLRDDLKFSDGDQISLAPMNALPAPKPNMAGAASAGANCWRSRCSRPTRHWSLKGK